MIGLEDDTVETLEALVQQLDGNGSGDIDGILNIPTEPARGILVVDDTVNVAGVGRDLGR